MDFHPHAIDYFFSGLFELRLRAFEIFLGSCFLKISLNLKLAGNPDDS